MKNVLITGASRGIGAATAELFAKNGYTVVAFYNNSHDEMMALKERIASFGGDLHAFRVDVSNEGQVADAFAKIKRLFHNLTAAVFCAGVSAYGQFCDLSSERFDRVMSVNAKGAFLCAKYALPLMKRGEASMTFLSSVWGLYGASCESLYAMSKHAVVGLARSLADEVGGDDLRICCLCPPMVDTAMTAQFTKEQQIAFNARFGAPYLSAQDVAQIVLQLAKTGENGKITVF